MPPIPASLSKKLSGNVGKVLASESVGKAAEIASVIPGEGTLAGAAVGVAHDMASQQQAADAQAKAAEKEAKVQADAAERTADAQADAAESEADAKKKEADEEADAALNPKNKGPGRIRRAVSAGGRALSSGGGISRWTILWILWAAFHLFDGLMMNFNRPASVATFGAILSLGFAFAVPLMRSARLIDEERYWPNVVPYLILCLLTAFIPYLLNFAVVKVPKLSMISFLYFLMNPWMLFIMFRCPEDALPAYILKWWAFFWIFLVLISIIASYSFQVPYNALQGDVGIGWRDFSDHLGDSMEKAWNKITNARTRIEQQVNGSLDEYYIMGTEEHTGQSLGVKLEEVQPIFPYFDPEQKPTVRGHVTAFSFLQDSMYVVPSCMIDRQREEHAEPIVDPQQLEVFPNHDEQFECRFENEPFEPGNYPVKVSATFDFETWADVTYYFVKEETSRNYARLGKDVHRELEIPDMPYSIYTNGPVRIGMGGSRTPVLVTSEPPYLKNAYLGFTVESAWSEGGELKRVKELELKVPEGFVLTECDRREGDVIEAQEDPDEPTYDQYIFRNVIDKELPYTSVRCKLGLRDLNTLAELDVADSATRTFIMRTSYEYQINSHTQFRVQE